MNFKKIVSFVLIFGILLAIPMTNKNFLLHEWDGEEIFVASTAGRDQAKEELEGVNDQIEDLEDEMSDLEGQLSQKAEALSDLLTDKAILENDIANTQAAIDQAKLDLEDAKEKEAKSYELMKIRIRYMYENSTQDSVWDAIVNSNGITDLLNRVEYINQVHNTDRKMLEDYRAIVENVEQIAAELESNMNDLVALQEIYERQEAELARAMRELEEEADDYQSQIASAKRRARELADYIAEQNRLIAQREQENNGGGGNGGGGNGGGNKKPSTSGGYLTDPSYDPAFTSGVSGEELVNYALQFVGNPYVWGGNSLTNGCDCSGFVNLIYKHFGFTGVPRYSQAFKSYGQPVAYVNIKPGDIVVYPGHVAIYIGNGRIVEAQSSRAGITSNRSVTCNTITGIRRVL